MALNIEQKKRLGIFTVLTNEIGMAETAAATFTHQWKRMHACSTEHLSTMLRAAIYHEIDEYRLQTYQTFGMGVLVSPAPSKDLNFYSPGPEPMELTIPFLGKFTVGYRQYEFAPYHGETPARTMRVRLHLGGIQVHFCGAWQPVAAYLDEVGTGSTERFDAEVASTRQSEWWKVNGKTFDLKGLPAELRELVYGHVLPFVVQPHPRHKCRGLSRLVVATKHTMALMRANKQIRDEMKHVLYSTKTFVIQHYVIMTKTVCNNLLQQHINRLTLSFSNSGYLDLFHFDQDSSITLPHPLVYPELREMRLKTFEFHIAAPSHIGEIEDACQIAAVDLILSVAWPSIKGHPVKISGWVKDSQKERIESLANDMKVPFDEWARLKKSLTAEDGASLSQYDAFMVWTEGEEQGGVRLDGKSWDDWEEKPELGLGLVPTLKTSTLEHHLQCRCPTTCCASTWTCEG